MIYLVLSDYDEMTLAIKAFASKEAAIRWVRDAQNLADEASRWQGNGWMGTTMDATATASVSYWYKEIELIDN